MAQSQNTKVELTTPASSFAGLSSYGNVMVGDGAFEYDNEKNVEDNSWKIWSYEHMYVSTSADEATKAFIEYMMGDEVQGGLVEQQGYIPMSGMKVEKDASGKVSSK